MKSNSTLILIIFLLFSCVEEFEDAIPEGASLGTPNLIANLNEEGEVILEWSIFRFCPGWCDPVVEGSRYEIFAKFPGGNEFVRIDRLGKESKEYFVANTEYGNPYEFYVTAHRAGQVTTSNTVMIIPNPFPEYETIMELENWNVIYHPKVNIQGDKVAYISNYKWSEGGQDYMSSNLFIKNLVSGQIAMIQKNCYHPQWSVDGRKVVYGTTEGLNQIAQGYTPIHMETYDVETKEFDRLKGGLHHINFPSFTTGNKAVLFLSDSLQRGNMGLWRINSNGSSEVLWPEFQLLDHAVGLPLFTALDASTISDWVAVDNLRTIGNRPIYNIYGFDLRSGVQKKDLLISQWNDMTPSFSPFDKNLLAFISDRTGKRQVWIIDIPNGKLLQVSFFLDDFHLSSGSTLSWTDQGRGIAFAVSSSAGVRKMVKIPIPN